MIKSLRKLEEHSPPKIIEAIYDISIANSILNGGKQNTLPIKSRPGLLCKHKGLSSNLSFSRRERKREEKKKKGQSLSLLLSNKYLGSYLARAIRQEKEINEIQITDDVILYLKYLKDFTRKLLNLINKFQDTKSTYKNL
jgi:hypothetical protein